MFKQPKFKQTVFLALMLGIFFGNGFMSHLYAHELGDSNYSVHSILDQRAENNYKLQCQGCHLVDGTSATDSIPDFHDYVVDFLNVPGGREFLVQVPGSYNAPLEHSELAEVLNWIVTSLLKDQKPDNFIDYTVDEIIALRTKPLINVGEVRAELVAKVHAMRAEID